MTVDSLLVDSVRALFTSTCTHDGVQAAERDGWAPEIWSGAAQMGLPWIGIPEAAGGSGGTLQDALAVLTVAGEYAAPIPLAEAGMLAGWLLTGAGYEINVGATCSVIPGRPDDMLELVDGRVTGCAHRVPWARSVDNVAALLTTRDGPVVALLPTASMRIELAGNLAGEPRDTVHLDHVEPTFLGPAASGIDASALHLRGALSRVALMAGALQSMSSLTQRYTSERHQFGKAVGSFQAVQQHLVLGAQEAAIVAMAAAVAGRAADRSESPVGARFEIAAAKMLADEAARTATRAAHQAHGAMGMTQEYSLHQLSRRLWSWRNEYGTTASWSRQLGGIVAEHGADGLYPLITGGSAA
ncbi:acyl-CoA dehydrogenase family protein [Mycolicibacterium sp.]|uniref:acyl-CoA dehydrogenase family protein n=1 Tax=Mycolicibacterium sp. TaxID=2320850 RepID=UPI001A1DA218|nr:acyl-CoA dehydrogenase family protein [Mycolicibacterium sp.]MBJ7336784.1 acyl-CoA dehydrogenase family protein [Mycolicibacterium sp.]